MTRTVLIYDNDSKTFRSDCGMTLARDHTGLTANGNPIAGRWALRDAGGALIDFDQYRNDLECRYNLSLIGSA